jgi:hypothetical protein
MPAPAAKPRGRGKLACADIQAKALLQSIGKAWMTGPGHPARLRAWNPGKPGYDEGVVV